MKDHAYTEFDGPQIVGLLTCASTAKSFNGTDSLKRCLKCWREFRIFKTANTKEYRPVSLTRTALVWEQFPLFFDLFPPPLLVPLLRDELSTRTSQSRAKEQRKMKKAVYLKDNRFTPSMRSPVFFSAAKRSLSIIFWRWASSFSARVALRTTKNKNRHGN